MKTGEQLKFIITKFVEGQINWKKEMVLAKRLLNDFNNFDFWVSLRPAKYGSLACLSTPKAKSYLQKQFSEFILDMKNSKSIEANVPEELPLGDAVTQQVAKKPKTLKEFLNG